MDKTFKLGLIHMKINNLLLFFTAIILLIGMTSVVSAEDITYDNGTIFLNNISNLHDNSTVLINSGEVTYSGIQTITASNILIKAEGTVIFKAKTTYNNYFLIKGDNVTIQGITFTKSFGNSAVVWDGSNGQIRNCTFTDNEAINGAAISWNGANGQIKNTTFINNLATKNGAAINWNGTNGQINNCLFYNNEAKGNGVISWTSVNGAIINSQFINCTAKTGSALYIKLKEDDENDHTTLTDNQFINCKSLGDNKANVISNAPNLYIYGGSGALISLEGTFASINSPVTVTILGNKTLSTVKGQTSDLTATINLDGENNTLIEQSFNFIINNKAPKTTNSGKIQTLSVDNNIMSLKIPAILNKDIYTASYTKNTIGTSLVSGKLNGNFYNVTYETGIINTKENPDIELESHNITYGDDSNIGIKINNQATGNITLSILKFETQVKEQESQDNEKDLEYSKVVYNQTVTKEIINGIVQFSIGKLAAGNYTIMAIYTGNEKYNGALIIGGFAVEKDHPIITIQTKTIKVGENAPVTIKVTDKNGKPITGNVTIAVDGENCAVANLTNGTAKLEIGGLSKGDHTITATFNGNENFTTGTNTVNIHVKAPNWWAENWLWIAFGNLGFACLGGFIGWGIAVASVPVMPGTFVSIGVAATGITLGGISGAGIWDGALCIIEYC